MDITITDTQYLSLAQYAHNSEAWAICPKERGALDEDETVLTHLSVKMQAIINKPSLYMSQDEMQHYRKQMQGVVREIRKQIMICVEHVDEYCAALMRDESIDETIIYKLKSMLLQNLLDATTALNQF